MKPAAALNRLPAASEVDFGGLPPWSVISTGYLTKALRLDRGLFATWRCRGIGPTELPPTWFRPAPGRPNYFVISDVMEWLEARRGQAFDHSACWVDFIRHVLGVDWAKAGHVRQLAAQQWLVPKGKVQLTRTGLTSYLDYLDRRGLLPAE